MGAMELQTIVERYAEAITELDPGAVGVQANRRTGEVYRPGFVPLVESTAVQMVEESWERLHPGELLHTAQGVPYPGLSRAACDHVLTVDDDATGLAEWGLEVKRIQLVGNNGKANDFADRKSVV